MEEKKNMTQKDIDGKDTEHKVNEDNIIVPEGNWEEQEDAEFYKFEKHGDTLEGMLVDKGFSDRYGFGLYDLKLPNGDSKRFHGSKQLDDLMKNVKDLDYIRVTYMDDQKLPQGSLKIYKVEIKSN